MNQIAETPKIVMFCGKGGVGKTTCASASAIYFASEGLKTLLISTDPSPSLTDILEIDVKGSVTSVKSIEGLDAVELDYERVTELWLDRYGDEVYEVVSAFLPVGREILDYIAGAPGIDQEFALGYLHDHYTSDKYDVIVWDTAPSGDTLRLLHLQETFYNHMIEAAKLYIKLKETLEKLTGQRKSDPLMMIKKWEKLAADVLDMIRAPETSAYLVTIPEGLGVAQTERTRRDLEQFKIKIDGLIINTMIPIHLGGSSELLQKRIAIQDGYIKEIQELYGTKYAIRVLELQDFEVKGIEALKKVSKHLYTMD